MKVILLTNGLDLMVTYVLYFLGGVINIKYDQYYNGPLDDEGRPHGEGELIEGYFWKG